MKNHLYIASLVLFCISGVLFSCKKDKTPLPTVPPTGDNCPEMYNLRSMLYDFTVHKSNVPPNCATMPEFVYVDAYIYSSPILNPNSPYEFLFLRRNSTQLPPARWDLCLYNFCSNKLTVLDGNIISGIDWSSTNWACYRSADGFQYVKLNISTGEKVEFGALNQASSTPIWNESGTKFIVNSTNNGKQVYSSEGNLLTSFAQEWYSCTWLNDSTLIYSLANNLRIFQLNSLTSEHFLNTPEITAGRIFNKNGFVYFNSNFGLHKTNGNTNELLDSSFYTYYADNLQPIPNTQKHLLHRVILDTIEYPCKVFVRNSISIFNSSTNTERRIIFPN